MELQIIAFSIMCDLTGANRKSDKHAISLSLVFHVRWIFITTSLRIALELFAKNYSEYGYQDCEYGYEDSEYGYQDSEYGYEDSEYGYEDSEFGYQDSEYGYEESEYGYQDSDYGYQDSEYI